MEHSTIRSLCCVSLVMNLCGNAALAASAEQTPAVTYAFSEEDPQVMGPPCGTETLEFNEVGNQLRFRLLNYALMVSEDPRVTGLSTVDVTVKINTVSQRGIAQGSVTLEPAGFAGTWEGDFNLLIPGNKPLTFNGFTALRDGRINMRGTGVFEGQWFLVFHAFNEEVGSFEPPVADPDGAGGCDFFGEVWSGRILDPSNG